MAVGCGVREKSSLCKLWDLCAARGLYKHKGLLEGLSETNWCLIEDQGRPFTGVGAFILLQSVMVDQAFIGPMDRSQTTMWPPIRDFRAFTMVLWRVGIFGMVHSAL